MAPDEASLARMGTAVLLLPESKFWKPADDAGGPVALKSIVAEEPVVAAEALDLRFFLRRFSLLPVRPLGCFAVAAEPVEAVSSCWMAATSSSGGVGCLQSMRSVCVRLCVCVLTVGERGGRWTHALVSAVYSDVGDVTNTKTAGSNWLAGWGWCCCCLLGRW